MRYLLLAAAAVITIGGAAQAQTISGSAGGTLGQGFAGVTSGSGVQGWSGINGAAAAFSQGGSVATMAGEMPGGIGGTAYSFHQGAGTAVGDQAAAGFLEIADDAVRQPIEAAFADRLRIGIGQDRDRRQRHEQEQPARGEERHGESPIRSARGRR